MSLEDWKNSEKEQRQRLHQQWQACQDPVFRAAYELAKRAGFDWYDTESAARRMAEHAGGEIRAASLALQAVLLFHSSETWNGERQRMWTELTGSDEATTRNLCIFVRAALDRIVRPHP